MKDASCSIQGIFEMRASLTHLFSTFACRDNVPQKPYSTPLEMKTEKTTTQYQNYSTNTGSCTQ